MSGMWGSRRLSGIWLCCFLFNFAAFPLPLCLVLLYAQLLSFLLPLVHVHLVNLAFLTLETSHPFGLVHFLPFVYTLWNLPGSLFFSLDSIACSRFDSCFWPLPSSTPINPVVFPSCLTIGGLQCCVFIRLLHYAWFISKHDTVLKCSMKGSQWTA